MKHKPASPTHFLTYLASWESRRHQPDLQAPRLRAEPRHLGPETPSQHPEVAEWTAVPLALPDPTDHHLPLSDEMGADERPGTEAELVGTEPLAGAEPESDQVQNPVPPLLLQAPAPLLSEYEEVLFAKIKAQHEQAQAQPPVDELAELEQSVDELVRQVRAEFFGRRTD
jgi:hypothetical protein